MSLRLLLLLASAIVLTSCASPEPSNLFNTGRDARVYNPTTGRYEWPH